MSASEAAGAVPPSAEQPVRPNVLAFMSPTTSRYLVFLAALLTAGAFVGSWLHNQTQFRDWVRVIAGCAEQAQQATAAAALPPEQVALVREAVDSKCRAGVERRRAGYSLGGIGVAGVGGLVIVYVAPVVIRRRQRLRPPGPALQAATDRFDALAAQAGITRTPRLERGSAAQHDAFSYGAPGRPRVVLPPAVAVRWRDPTLFDPLVRHELAHVRHHDVALAWLARSVWYALAPLLALPLIVMLLADRSILVDYLWRTALLGLTVLLVSSALLRSREHDADLRAAQTTGGITHLIAVLHRTPDQVRRIRVRRIVARHPTAAQRIQILQHPERATSVTFFDGFTSAFLAALLIPLAVNVLVVLFTGTGRTDLAELVTALLAGPLLGGSVGLALWRAAVVGRIAGTGVPAAPAAGGVATGLALGQLASLAGTGSGATSGLNQPGWLAISAALGGGATALSAGLGQLWADAMARVRWRRTAVAAALAVNGLIFATALWIGTTLQFALDNGGWTVGRAWLVTLLPAADLVLGTVVVLALSTGLVLWVRTNRAVAPTWLIERGAPPPWPVGSVRARQMATATLVPGIIAAVSLAAFRAVAGPATSDAALEQRYWLYIWVAAAAGGACAFALCRLDAVRGSGLACLAAPGATLTAVVGWLILNTALGGQLSVHFILDVARAPLGLGLLFSLIAALAGLIRPTSPSLARTTLAHLLPATCAAVIIALLILGRDTIMGPAILPTPASANGSVADTAAKIDGLRYLGTIAPAIVATFSATQRSVAAIDADQTADGPTRAAQIQAEVLPQLRALLQQAKPVRPIMAKVAATHSACIAAVQDAAIEYSLFARAYQNGDTLAFTQAKSMRQVEQIQWRSCLSGILDLQTTLGGASQGESSHEPSNPPSSSGP